MGSEVSVSWVASWRSCSAFSAECSADIAWFANSRSACSRVREGSSRSRGSSTQISPIRLPSGSDRGTSSQWRFHACGPRPFSSDS